MSNVFTNENFEAEVIKSDLPVLVDFYADWCGPCMMMMPIVDELEKKYKRKWKIGKVNIDDSPKIAMDYGIQSIPSLKFFKNGEVVDQLMGFQAKEKIEEKLS